MEELKNIIKNLKETFTGKHLDVLMEALEKQIPKNPISNGGADLYYHCPICNECELEPNCEDYCPRCGQKLKWGNDTDNEGNLTLGELESRLSEFSDNEQFVLSNGKFLTGRFDSYRGNYEDIYFDFSVDDNEFNTIGQLKKMISNAYYIRYMQGYKGGSFIINRDTIIWISKYGCCGDKVVDVKRINKIITIIIK